MIKELPILKTTIYFPENYFVKNDVFTWGNEIFKVITNSEKISENCYKCDIELLNPDIYAKWQYMSIDK